mmetsp:Transcript_11009/g.16501  ORF Transcript_11009/g.16501 Transcript_11009/m.16501 type:complete len:168 (-) Transcript_11009:82-585(-)
MPAGAIRVVFRKGTASKWLDPTWFDQKLRRAAQPAAVPASDGLAAARRQTAFAGHAPDQRPKPAAEAATFAPAPRRKSDSAAGLRPQRIQAERLTQELVTALSHCPKDYSNNITTKVRNGSSVDLEIRQGLGYWQAIARVVTVTTQRHGHTQSTTTRRETFTTSWTP